MLRRLSARAIEAPRRALLLAALVLGALGAFGIGVEPHLSQSTLVVKGTASARAVEIAAREFGESVTIPVLLTGPAAALEEQGPRLVRALRADRANRVVSAFDGARSSRALRPRADAAMVLVAVDRPIAETIEDGQSHVRDAVAREISGPVEPHITGFVAIGQSLKEASFDEIRRAERVAVPLLLIVLLLVFRSVAAAAIPAALGGATVLASFGGLRLLTEVVALDVVSVSLASMMGLALGVDYSLLMVSRFREELAGQDGPDAVIRAARATVATAGRTVRFAGAVLAISMAAALVVAPGDLLVSAAAGVMVAVAIGVVAAAVVVPATLVLAGHRLSPRRRGEHARGVTARLALRVLERPAVPALAVLALLGGLSVPALALKTGAPDVRALPASERARQDFEVVRRVMGPGWSAPFEIVIAAREGTITEPQRLRALARWEQRIAALPGVVSVVGPGALARELPRDGLDTRRLASTGRAVRRGRRSLAKLEQGLGDATGGVARLRGGIARATNGAKRLERGGVDAAGGADDLAAGMRSARDGSRDLATGLRRARSAATQLSGGARRAEDGASRLADDLAKVGTEVRGGLDEASALPERLRGAGRDLGQLRKPVDVTERKLQDARTALERMTVGRADPRYASAYAATLEALAAVSGRDPRDGSKVDPSYDGLDAAIGTASDGLTAAAGEAARAVGDTRRLAYGLDDLARAAHRLTGGTERLSAANAKLARGLAAAASGGTNLADGLAKLAEGTGALSGGIDRLAIASGSLAGGLDTGGRRTRTLEQGLRDGAGRLDGAGLPSQRDADALSRLGRTSPDLGDSGYLVLAAADGAPTARRAQASFAVSLQRGGRAGRILVVPASGPNEPAARALGDRLRAELPALARATGADAALGGSAAVLEDYDKVTSARFVPLIATLTLVTALALIVLFRSLLLPLVAVGLNLVTVGAAFGVLALLFQGDAPLGGPGYLDAVSVSGIFTVLFGLSIDYQVFLVLRMREGYLDTGDPRAAIAYGLERTAKVVTGAAAIMLGVFCAFSLAEVSGLRQFGIGLMVAVLIDATLVRLVLLPALMRALGDRCWWLPAWLDRRLPHLDVEGERHADRTVVTMPPAGVA